MTVDDVRREATMADALRACGLPGPGRGGFIRCPFHEGDRRPSLKLYERDYHCFGCGAHGDAIGFVMRYAGKTFPEAIAALGGEPPRGPRTFAERRLARRSAADREAARRREAGEREERRRLLAEITRLRRECEAAEPLGDAWCEAKRGLLRCQRRLDWINGIRE